MPEHNVEETLRGLRAAVERVVTPPPAAAIRARAGRSSFRPKVVTGLVAAAAVIAVVAGATAAVRAFSARGNADPAGPPASTPTVPTSHRPPSWPPPLTDPIARVDWKRAVIDVPASVGRSGLCPTGRLRLSGGASAGWPRLVLGVPEPQPAYGDLTGDGRPEAVVYAECLGSAEDSGDGEGQLIVVAREADGTLRALGWAGERGAVYAGFWVTGGTLYADAHPWYTDWGYSLGAALAYRWSGSAFTRVDSGYPGLQPVGSGPGPEIDLGPVAERLGCPGPVVRIAASESPGIGPTTATADGYVYDFAQPQQPENDAILLDLSGDGHRYLAVAVACRPAGTADSVPPQGQGLLVLDRDGAGFRAVDLVPVDPDRRLVSWSYDRGQLTIGLDPSGTRAWRWNGTRFEPA